MVHLDIFLLAANGLAEFRSLLRDSCLAFEVLVEGSNHDKDILQTASKDVGSFLFGVRGPPSPANRHLQS